MERNPAVRTVAACVAAGLVVIAATVFVRRIAVDSLRDLPAGEAAAYAAVFAFACAVTLRTLAASRGAPGVRMADAASVLLALFFAAGLTTSPVGALACVFAAAAVAGLLTLPERFQGAATSVEKAVGDPNRRGSEFDTTTVDRFERPAGGETAGAEPELRLLRSVREGRQTVEGTMRFEVPAGEAAHTLHVPLWPPLPGEPAVRCELDGIEGRVRVPVAKPYGLRIEVRVPEPVDEPLAGVVRFTAECAAGAAAA